MTDNKKVIYYTHCNSDEKMYNVQTDNSRDPLISCFPTSMINWANVIGIPLPENTDNRFGTYNQKEDQFDFYTHNSPELKPYLDKYVSIPWVNKYLKDGGDIRELWDVEVKAFNSFIGETHAKVNYNIRIEDIIYEIQCGRAVVTTGKFCGLALGSQGAWHGISKAAFS